MYTLLTFQPLLLALNCFLVLFQFLFCEMAERVGWRWWCMLIIFKLHWLEKRKPQNLTVKKKKQERYTWLMSLFCPKFGDARLAGNTEEKHICIQTKTTLFNMLSHSNEHWPLSCKSPSFCSSTLIIWGIFVSRGTASGVETCLNRLHFRD